MSTKKLYDIKKSTHSKEKRRLEILSSILSFKFVLITGGSCNIIFEEKNLKGQAGDIIIMSPGNKIFIDILNKRPLELFEISITLEYLTLLSTDNTNFVNCLNVMPLQCAIITTSTETLLLLKNISATLLNTELKEKVFAQELYEQNLLSMFIILTIRSAIRAEAKEKAKKRSGSLIDELIIFIKFHITEEIPLERLEKEFFVSKYHISREFKKHTGMTLHRYIVKNKLELCKKLLEQGNSVVDVYKHCGLGGYNHMFRAFKKEFGITPMEYLKEINSKNNEFK